MADMRGLSQGAWWKICGAIAVVAAIAFVAVAVFVDSTRAAPPDSTPVPALAPATSVAAPTTVPTTSEPTTPRSVVAFVGDSYTQGVGVEPSTERWSSQLSAAMNWDERNFGLAGTGYLATAGSDVCGLDSCPNYQTTALDAVAANPSIVVVSGGQNDVAAYAEDPAAVQTAIATTYVEIRNALPDVRIIAVGPSTTGEVTDAMLGLDRDVRDTAGAFGAQYVSLLEPPTITPANVLPDGENVDSVGHNAISRRVQAAL
ncbi:SGNH/GDSL hydrolase family protein [Rhodococcoides fascians]|uniref:SGNH/GDSL hydrolase family protein n=1 Tax=Rhodococcoides fascians TaxID=1828 RepID=UPI0009B87AB7|nr:SGNH/GDSL hydrolase family protein [Rhodococcus fascians]